MPAGAAPGAARGGGADAHTVKSGVALPTPLRIASACDPAAPLAHGGHRIRREHSLLLLSQDGGSTTSNVVAARFTDEVLAELDQVARELGWGTPEPPR